MLQHIYIDIFVQPTNDQVIFQQVNVVPAQVGGGAA